MSRPRFAAITADLLARKGEAQSSAAPPRNPLAWEKEQTRAPVRAPLQDKELPPLAMVHGADGKKIAVRISHHDYERLGILAVKQNTTRQRLLQEAADGLLAGMPRNFGGACACLANAGAEQGRGEKPISFFLASNSEERFVKGERS
jgi:hypothetical protein